MNVYYAKGEQWEEEEKSWWHKKSKLERNLIISLMIVLVVLASLSAFFTIKHIVETPKICITQECLLMSSQIIAHTDIATDPCEDFFHFACGKFIKQIHGDVQAASGWSLKDTVQRQMLEILEEPIQSEDHYLVKNQKKLFQACMNESFYETGAVNAFNKTLQEIGGWPVVAGHLWKASHFDWKDTVYELRSRGYLYSMILSIVLAEDPLISNRFIIYVNAPYINVIKEEQKQLYKKYMIDVAVAFGAEKALATYEAESVLYFMDKLKYIYDKNYSFQQNQSNGYNSTADVLSRRTTIDEFQNQHDEIQWLDFINTIISPAANISSSDYAIFPNSDYVNDLFQLIYRTRKRIQANYIIWRVIESIMPFMPQNIQQFEATYSCLSEKKSSPDPKLAEKCEQLATTSFFPAPSNILYTRKYLSSEKRERVKDLSNNIKSQFVEYITDSVWLDEENRYKVLQKTKEVQITVGFNGDYFNNSIFDQYIYNTIEYEDDDNDDFFNLILISKKRLIDTMYSLLYLPINESVSYEMYGEDGITYLEYFNSIVIKAEFLQGIFYNEERPAYSNYATIGTKIARKLMALASNAFTLNETNTQAECFTKRDGDVITTSENVLNYASLKVSYEAYKKWVEEHEEELQLPGIAYTPNQLFWISSMISQCYDLENYIDSKKQSQDILAALWPLKNNDDFAGDFSCSTGTKMNPIEKCHY